MGKKIKVLHLCSNDQGGGAARAAFRLNKALNQKSDIDSWMLVQRKASYDPKVIGPKSQFLKALYMAKPRFDSIGIQPSAHFSVSRTPSLGILKQIKEANPDVVHLHWINEGMLRIEDLEKIKRPILWSLHDMWPFTGGCHYTGTCEKFGHECNACPVLGSDRYKDLSFQVFNRKRKSFSKLKITANGLSRWIAEEGRRSPLFKNVAVTNIPNTIDTEFFCPLNRKESKIALGLDPARYLILFGAVNPRSERRKGYEELVQALNHLDASTVTLGILGNVGEELSELKNISSVKFGLLGDDISLKMVYNAADVTVVPSLQENLSNMILESMSCGTPAVAFNIGGNADMIDHRVSGYLATPFSTTDLEEGIQWVIDLHRSGDLSKEARKKVVEEFSYDVVADSYAELYEKIVNKS